MRVRLPGRWGTCWRVVWVIAVGMVGAGVTGCVRHVSQADSLRLERREIAPEQCGFAVAEVPE